MSLIGYAPVRDEGSGAFIDTSGDNMLQAGEIDTGALGPRRREKLRARLEAKLEQLGGAVQSPVKTAYDAHDFLPASGFIDRNRYIGLGYTPVLTVATGTLTATAERTCWAKAIILQSNGGTNAAAMVVTQITFAGIPETIGTGGIPIQAFDYANTRYGFATNKPLATGQQAVVNFYNYHSATIGVSGNLIVDEVDPGVQRRLLETDLLRAANMVSQRCG